MKIKDHTLQLSHFALLGTGKYRCFRWLTRGPEGSGSGDAGSVLQSYADLVTASIVVLALAIGLALDHAIEIWGQIAASVMIWTLFFLFTTKVSVRERGALFACIAYATAGELFLSLGWGLYSYRLENVPLYVPPAHVLLFVLGRIVAKRVNDSTVWLFVIGGGVYVAYAAHAGFDTFGLLLFAFFALCVFSGNDRKLYASMFGLALALELYGTWLGNWRWLGEIARFNLVTTNPPVAAGAFYCVLDFLVVATFARLRRAKPAPCVELSSDACPGPAWARRGAGNRNHNPGAPG